MKRLLAAIMVGVLLFGVSCGRAPKDEMSAYMTSTEATNSISGEMTDASESGKVIRLEDMVIQNLQINRNDATNVRVTGQISEHIQIDADLICTVDPNEPGEGKAYSAKLKIFPEELRYAYVQTDWKAKEFDVWFKYDFASNGGVYFDTYEDEAGNQYIYLQTSSFLEYCTPSGYLMWFITPGLYGDEKIEDMVSSEDFTFMDAQTALNTAKVFTETFEINVSDYYKTFRIPREEFLYEAKVRENHRVEADPPEDAYCFTLFQKLDGLPVAGASYIHVFSKEIAEPHLQDAIQRVLGTDINVIVTQNGIEYAQISESFENISELSSGTMCSLEDALNTYAEYIVSVTETINSDDVCVYYPDPIRVDAVSLMQVPIQNLESEEIVIRPYWVFFSIQRHPIATDYELYSFTYIDALTGEVLNTRFSSSGESA